VSEAVKEVVALSKAGLVVPYGKPVLLAKAIVTLLQNRKLWIRFSTKGRTWAKQFTWDRAARMTLDIIKKWLTECE